MLAAGGGGESVHPVLHAACCPRVPRSTGDPGVVPGCLLSNTMCRGGCGSPYCAPFSALLFAGVTQGQGQAGDFGEQSCRPCVDTWQCAVSLLLPAKRQLPGAATLLAAHGSGYRDNPELAPVERLNHAAQHRCAPRGAGSGPPSISFLPPSPVDPPFSSAVLGGAPQGCSQLLFGAEELELPGMGSRQGMEGSWSKQIVVSVDEPRAWLSLGMWHSPSVPVCTRRGQGWGPSSEGWPRPRRGAGAGWVRCLCPRAGGAEVAPAISSSLRANREGAGGDTGHATWEHGVQRGGVCGCPREQSV